MSDVAIQPIGTPDYRSVAKIVPTYLVTLEGKKETYFIATRFDDSYVHCGKFVGFFHNASSVQDISTKFDEIIRATDPSNFVEILFPWTKIQSIRSLVYKHKATGERK